MLVGGVPAPPKVPASVSLYLGLSMGLQAEDGDAAVSYLYFLLAYAALHRRGFAAEPQRLLNAHEPLDHCLSRPCDSCLLSPLKQQQHHHHQPPAELRPQEEEETGGP